LIEDLLEGRGIEMPPIRQVSPREKKRCLQIATLFVLLLSLFAPAWAWDEAPPPAVNR
jgi:hypothetical protein